MKLTLEGLKDKEAWKRAGIQIPEYDIEAVTKKTVDSPRWVHFGIGNIFRIFMGTVADDLIAAGEMDRGITCIETFDFDQIDQIYEPYDNLALCVTLHRDGTSIKRVIGSLSEAVGARPKDAASRKRIEEIFMNPELQMATFTITEKGYALKGSDGNYFGFVKADLENGPDADLNSAMSLVTAMLKKRFEAGAYPMALVSTDNVSQNGKALREAVLTVADEWHKKGFVDQAFLDYVGDEAKVAFPWSMIDKITPRPSETVAEMLEKDGVEDMKVVVTSKKTYIAPFVNAEGPQYLVIEDSFPNGRPPLEKAGIYMTDRDTVNASERMKVTVCLNPTHTALGPYGRILGIPTFWQTFVDPDLRKLAELVGPREGMEVVVDPKILSPQAFLDELFTERFPNPNIPDTTARICTDISQMEAIRFGVTTSAFVEKYGDAKRLLGIPLAIAGYLRYALALDDNGEPFELSPDPMNDEMTEKLSTIVFGKPESLTDQLKPILSSETMFGINLYDAGIGEKIEGIFRELIAGKGAVRETIHKYVKDVEVNE